LIKNLTAVDENVYCKVLFDPSERAVFPFLRDILKYVSYRCKHQPKKLDGEFISYPVSFAMEANHVLYAEFENVVQLIGSSGLLLHYRKYLNWCRYVIHNRIVEVISEPEVFSVNKLSYGFVIWLSACGVSTVAFLMESILYLLPFALKRIYTILLGVIRSFYDLVVKISCNFVKQIGNIRSNIYLRIIQMKKRIKNTKFNLRFKRRKKPKGRTS
jgi:hypothetical protein